jgi:tRNA threonylcarbamoyladenosine biosynthesis protein TsaE
MMEIMGECLMFNETQLMELGQWFASFLKGNEAIALNGSLGSGKTMFTKGLAKGLNIKEEIISPTFVLLREYPQGKFPLFHFDLYRLEDPKELHDIGFIESLDLEGIKVVEWADRFPQLLDCYNWMLEFSIPCSECRKIKFYVSS